MKQADLTKEQLELLNGNSNDVQEMSISDMLGIAGGCHKPSHNTHQNPSCHGGTTTPPTTTPPTTNPPPTGGYGSPSPP